MDGMAVDGRVDQAVKHRLGRRPGGLSSGRSSAGGRRTDSGEEVRGLIGGEERCEVEDAGLLLLGPGHRLEEADAGLDTSVEEELERDGEEVEGITRGADGAGKVERVEEAQHFDVGVEGPRAGRGRRHLEGETAARGGGWGRGPTVREQGGEVAGPQEGRGGDVQVKE